MDLNHLSRDDLTVLQTDAPLGNTGNGICRCLLLRKQTSLQHSCGARLQKFLLKGQWECPCGGGYSPGAGREWLQPSKEESITKSSPSSRCKLSEGSFTSTRGKDKHVCAVLMVKDARTCLTVFRRLL